MHPRTHLRPQLHLGHQEFPFPSPEASRHQQTWVQLSLSECGRCPPASVKRLVAPNVSLALSLLLRTSGAWERRRRCWRWQWWPQSVVCVSLQAAWKTAYEQSPSQEVSSRRISHRFPDVPLSFHSFWLSEQPCARTGGGHGIVGASYSQRIALHSQRAGCHPILLPPIASLKLQQHCELRQDVVHPPWSMRHTWRTPPVPTANILPHTSGRDGICLDRR
mmetsp:Transcript_83694/g.223860  ORF Transcript_83694/g.223860 Transcript_83694/m.223860 type:complete len:220 (-) Transcript_83694:2042-2701(-)